MSLSMRVSDARFRIAMSRLRDYTKQSIYEFLGEQFRLLMEKVAAFTPPNNLSQGRSRVEKDILKVMRPVDVSSIRDERLKAIVRRGDYKAFAGYAKGVGREREMRAMPFDKERHTAARDRRGRVRMSGGRAPYVLGGKDELELRKYIRHKQGNVGIARDGWTPALRAVGGNVPSWVSRHGGKFGAVRDDRSGDKPSMTAINRTPWASRKDEGERIIRDAMKSRTAAMRTALQMKMKLAAQKAGFSG